METISRYILSVVAVCMLGVLAVQMVRQERMKKILRFLSGLLILSVALPPLMSFDGRELSELMEQAEQELALEMPDFAQQRQDALGEHIKNTAERYIEEKAAALGALVQAEVRLSCEEYPKVQSVILVGTASPTQYQELSDYLSRELGLPPERQEWRLYG